LQYIRYYLNKYTVGEFVLSDSYTLSREEGKE
jgi:hypothetical protein